MPDLPFKWNGANEKHLFREKRLQFFMNDEDYKERVINKNRAEWPEEVSREIRTKLNLDLLIGENKDEDNAKKLPEIRDLRKDAVDLLIEYFSLKKSVGKITELSTDELIALVKDSDISFLPEDLDALPTNCGLPDSMLYRLADSILKLDRPLSPLENMILEDTEREFPFLKRNSYTKRADRLLEKLKSGNKPLANEQAFLAEAAIFLPKKADEIYEILATSENSQKLLGILTTPDPDKLDIRTLLCIRPIAIINTWEPQQIEIYCKRLCQCLEKKDVSPAKPQNSYEATLLSAFLIRELTPALRNALQKKISPGLFGTFMERVLIERNSIFTREQESNRESLAESSLMRWGNHKWLEIADRMGMSEAARDALAERRLELGNLEKLRANPFMAAATINQEGYLDNSYLEEIKRVVTAGIEEQRIESQRKRQLLLTESSAQCKLRLQEVERHFKEQKPEWTEVIKAENPIPSEEEASTDVDKFKQREVARERIEAATEAHPRQVFEYGRRISELVEENVGETELFEKLKAEDILPSDKPVIQFIGEVLNTVREMEKEIIAEPFISALDFAEKWNIDQLTAKKILNQPTALRNYLDIRSRDFLSDIIKRNPSKEKIDIQKVLDDPFYQELVRSRDLGLSLIHFTRQKAEELETDVEEGILEHRRDNEISSDEIQGRYDNVQERIKKLGIPPGLGEKAKKAAEILRSQAGILVRNLDHIESDKEVRKKIGEQIVELKIAERRLRDIAELTEPLDIVTSQVPISGRCETQQDLFRAELALDELNNRKYLSAEMQDIERILTGGIMSSEKQKNQAHPREVEMPPEAYAQIKQAIDQKKQALSEFAKWVLDDEPLTLEKLKFFTKLSNPDGTPVLSIVSDNKWKGKISRAKFKPIQGGFQIEIPESIYDEAIKWGDLSLLKDLATSLRHESLHAIDHSCATKLSSKFYELTKRYSSNFDDKLDRFRELTGNRHLGIDELKEELFASAFSSETNWDIENLMNELRGSIPEVELAAFKRQLQEAADSFVDNGINLGFWGRFTGTRNRSVKQQQEDILAASGAPVRNPDEMFEFGIKRENIRNLIAGLLETRVKVPRKQEYISSVEAEMNAIQNILQNEAVTVAEFDQMKKDMGKWESQLGSILEKIALVEGGDTDFFRDLWQNTYFIKPDDLSQYISKFASWWKRRYAINQKRRVGRTGFAFFKKLLPSLASEFDIDQNQAGNEEFQVYKKGIVEMDSWEIMEKVINNPRNKDHLKAGLDVLAEKGAIDWNDTRFWRALEKFQSAVRFIPSDKRNREVLVSKLRKAFDVIYDKDFFSSLDRKADGNYDSEIKKFQTEANKNDAFIGKIIESMLHEKESGKNVNPHRFEGYLLYAMHGGKYTPEAITWFIFRGAYLGLLSSERIIGLKGSSSNQLPMSVWFTNLKPSIEHVKKIGARFPPKDGKMPPEFMDWLQVEMMSNDQVAERMRKALSTHELDAGWVQLNASIGDFNSTQNVFANNTGGKPHVSPNGRPNILSGQLLRITSLARHRDKFDRKKMLDMVTMHVEYVTSYNAVILNRANIPGLDHTGTGVLIEKVPVQENYISKEQNWKTGLEYIEANQGILRAADPILFDLIYKEGRSIQENMPKIQRHIRTHYQSLDSSITIPHNDQKLLGDIARYMRVLFNRHPEKLDAILDAAARQYQADHAGEPAEKPYKMGGLPDIPNQEHGMWGSE